MDQFCNNCEHREKLAYSTIYLCKKYNEALNGNPPVKLEQCKLESEKKSKKKKEYIEVK